MMGWHGGMIWNDLFDIVLIAFGTVITAAVLVGLRVRSGSSSSGDQSPALRLLDERLARGEIDIEEYARTRELLRTSR